MKKFLYIKNLINPATKLTAAGLTVSLALTLLACCMSGCFKPSFPKEKLIAKIKKVVKDEYGYDIRARIVGKTFGLFFPVTQILDHDNTMKDNFEKKSQHIFTSAIRACLSTDADIDYFVIKFTGKLKGIEIKTVRSVNDTKRVLLGNISRNDYQTRSVFHYAYDLDYKAETFIRNMFKTIPENKSSLTSFFLPGDKFDSSFWFSQLMESELKQNMHYEIIKISTKQISKDTVLIYAKVKEEYAPKPGYENYNFKFPSGHIHKFLFELILFKGIFPQIIENYSFKDKENGETVTPKLPEVFAEHMDIENWDEYFYLEDVNEPEFIIGQVSTKLNRKLSEAANPETERLPDDTEFLSEAQPITLIDSSFIAQGDSKTKEKTFQILFYFNETAMKETISDELLKMTLTFFKRILKKYDYKNYNELVLLSSKGNVLKKLTRQEIDKIESDKFEWESLFKPSQY